MRSVLGTRKVRVGPARARRRGRRTVEPGTHRYSEALPDRTDRFGAEAVGTDACDSPVLFLETEDDLQGLAPPACREQQCDWLALELDALDAHGVGPGLRRPLVMPMNHLVEEVRRALGGMLAADVELGLDVLFPGAVEHEGHDTSHVLGDLIR